MTHADAGLGSAAVSGSFRFESYGFKAGTSW
jgi:hypothetical protein